MIIFLHNTIRICNRIIYLHILNIVIWYNLLYYEFSTDETTPCKIYFTSLFTLVFELLRYYDCYEFLKSYLKRSIKITCITSFMIYRRPHYPSFKISCKRGHTQAYWVRKNYHYQTFHIFNKLIIYYVVA